VAVEVDEIDQIRAQEYGLLALLVGKAPTAEVLRAVAGLKGDASPLGMAHVALADAARAISVADAQREHFQLFIGVGRGELMPYASFYLTGFLHERPLARVREDLSQLGIARDAAVPEPEDHLALLCEAMSGLVAGQFGDEAERTQRFFERHLQPWAARCFADLEHAESAKFYRAVGTVGRLFMDIEAEAYALDA
jgi:TorA maturation chaperone TorD